MEVIDTSFYFLRDRYVSFSTLEEDMSFLKKENLVSAFVLELATGSIGFDKKNNCNEIRQEFEIYKKGISELNIKFSLMQIQKFYELNIICQKIFKNNNTYEIINLTNLTNELICFSATKFIYTKNKKVWDNESLDFVNEAKKRNLQCDTDSH